MSIELRKARPEDLGEILRIEACWPESGRAGEDKFLARMKNFGEGFFVGWVVNPDGTEQAAGTITSMPLRYDPAHLEGFRDWGMVTKDGYLGDCDPAGCNALYIVSGVIDPVHRGANVFQHGVAKMVELATRMGMSYVLAGAVIPGYAKYCEAKGEIPAFDYCRLRRGVHLVDPLLSMYEAMGFHVTDQAHVIPEYFPDDASRNYAALVRRDLKPAPTSAG